MTPPMVVARESSTEVTLTANPVLSKNVLKTIPRDSPQLVTQKQLNATMKNSFADRWEPSPVAMDPKTEKTRELKISKGISAMVYCTKKAPTP